MKFYLTIWLCSFLNNTCTPPIEIDKIYNSWNECVEDAAKVSLELINAAPDSEELRLATKYLCKESNVI